MMLSRTEPAGSDTENHASPTRVRGCRRRYGSGPPAVEPSRPQAQAEEGVEPTSRFYGPLLVSRHHSLWAMGITARSLPRPTARQSQTRATATRQDPRLLFGPVAHAEETWQILATSHRAARTPEPDASYRIAPSVPCATHPAGRALPGWARRPCRMRCRELHNALQGHIGPACSFGDDLSRILCR